MIAPSRMPSSGLIDSKEPSTPEAVEIRPPRRNWSRLDVEVNVGADRGGLGAFGHGLPVEAALRRDHRVDDGEPLAQGGAARVHHFHWDADAVGGQASGLDGAGQLGREVDGDDRFEAQFLELTVGAFQEPRRRAGRLDVAPLGEADGEGGSDVVDPFPVDLAGDHHGHRHHPQPVRGIRLVDPVRWQRRRRISDDGDAVPRRLARPGSRLVQQPLGPLHQLLEPIHGLSACPIRPERC